MSAEPYYKFNTLNADVTDGPDGLLVRFTACGQRLRFGPNGQAQEIGGAILEHTGNCSRCKGQAAIDLPRFNGNPKAPTMGDLITPKQIGAVGAIARAAGLNSDEICAAMFGCMADELGRRAASIFIAALKVLDLLKRNGGWFTVRHLLLNCAGTRIEDLRVALGELCAIGRVVAVREGAEYRVTYARVQTIAGIS
ncbi:MAG TPA: hypothetical protein VNN73_17370 [Blastocatellia bacterium]|nr:hypothetical protein [Blastocatellia bacterium]